MQALLWLLWCGGCSAVLHGHAGVDYKVDIYQSVFGPQHRGALDHGSVVHPSMHMHGTALVDGQLVVLGDIHIRVGDRLISITHALGLGPEHEPVVDDAVETDDDAALAASLSSSICYGVDARRNHGCAARINWGYDSCNKEDTVCYCGGGYQRYSSAIVHTTLVCPDGGCAQKFFSGFSDTCCGPDNSCCDVDGVHCATALCTTSDYRVGTMCPDRARYMQAYDGRFTAEEARLWVNSAFWGATRMQLDTNTVYRVSLPHNIWPECGPSLMGGGSIKDRVYRLASWSCTTWSHVKLQSATLPHDTVTTYLRGSGYTIHTQLDTTWYCLAGPMASKDLQEQYLQSDTPNSADQLFFVPSALSYCRVIHFSADVVGGYGYTLGLHFALQGGPFVVSGGNERVRLQIEPVRVANNAP